MSEKKQKADDSTAGKTKKRKIGEVESENETLDISKNICRLVQECNELLGLYDIMVELGMEIHDICQAMEGRGMQTIEAVLQDLVVAQGQGELE